MQTFAYNCKSKIMMTNQDIKTIKKASVSVSNFNIISHTKNKQIYSELNIGEPQIKISDKRIINYLINNPVLLNNLTNILFFLKEFECQKIEFEWFDVTESIYLNLYVNYDAKKANENYSKYNEFILGLKEKALLDMTLMFKFNV